MKNAWEMIFAILGRKENIAVGVSILTSAMLFNLYSDGVIEGRNERNRAQAERDSMRAQQARIVYTVLSLRREVAECTGKVQVLESEKAVLRYELEKLKQSHK